jgi:hypothetical protein
MHVSCIRFNVFNVSLRLKEMCDIGALWIQRTLVLDKRINFISVPQGGGKCSSTGENIIYDTNKLAVIKVHRYRAPFFNCGNFEFPLKIEVRDMGEVVLLLNGQHSVSQVPIRAKMRLEISESLF